MILYAGSALRVRGIRLNATALRETPWGSLALSHGDDLATLDGQLELPLLEPRVRFDEVFEAARECEDDGDLDQAEKLYRLASEIDPHDAYSIFNRGNVLASLERGG